MKTSLKIIMAQMDFVVGDIKGNVKKIIAAANEAKSRQADMIIFPELTISGYPPEDLLLRHDFQKQVLDGLESVKNNVKDIYILIGYPEACQGKLYNSAMVIYNGETLANYHKRRLPNYGVFDEKRYFQTDDKTCVVDIKGIPCGITICEDLWLKGAALDAKKAGAKIILSPNASPFDMYKLQSRERILKKRVDDIQIPIVYVHMVGGQDEVVFDGRSMVMNKHGKIAVLGSVFKEDLITVEIEYDGKEVSIKENITEPPLDIHTKVYRALVLSVDDYIKKNKFSGALIGLSGGIDSALTTTIAVDALGADNVHAVLMPSRYTQNISIEDSIELAKNLGIKYSIIPIDSCFDSFLDSLKDEFANTQINVTEENIQTRCRAVILMALSNKFGKLVLTTGNKSELAVGYATLYGDMAGGFAVLKDVYKTMVYELAEFRNSVNPVIPRRIIERPPTAELAHGQLDQDLLPPYTELDEMLKHYIEEDRGIGEIVQLGFDKKIVERMIKMVDKNEYKRRQAPPGAKITTRAFGRDRRYPISSGFVHEV